MQADIIEQLKALKESAYKAVRITELEAENTELKAKVERLEKPERDKPVYQGWCIDEDCSDSEQMRWWIRNVHGYSFQMKHASRPLATQIVRLLNGDAKGI